MKKFYYYLVSMLVAAVVAVGCTEDITTDEGRYDEGGNVKTEFMEITATLEEGEDSRTTLYDGGNGGKVEWVANDAIAAVSADGTITKCTATSVKGSSATFSVPTDTKYALYPYINDTAKQSYNSETGVLTHTLYATHTLDGSNKVFNTNQNSMVAELSNNTLNFYHVCGFVEIKLKGTETVTQIALRNNSREWRPITGTGTLDLTDPTNPVFTGTTAYASAYHWVKATSNVQLKSDEATSFYLIVAPGTYENLSICVSTDRGSYQIISKNSITINRAMIRPFSTINLDELAPETTIDLSEDGVANCYVVPQSSDAKYYSFPARKIKATANIENVSYAHLTWSESKSLISDVSYNASTGMVSFKYEGNNAEGNACISLCNASNSVLWTFHIWCTDEPEMIVIRGKSGKMHGILDRNVGATFTPKTVAEAEAINETTGTDALGLNYQYGRVNPFPRAITIKTNKESAAFADNSKVELQYGYGSYSQKFVRSTAQNSYTSVTQSYPTFFYCVRYSDKNGETQNNSGSYYLWTKDVYSTTTQSDMMWSSAAEDVIETKATNDPCPAGYIIDEQNAVNDYIAGIAFTRVYWGAGNTQAYGHYYECPATGSILYIPASGFRTDSGVLSYHGQNFNLWAYPTSATESANGKIVAGRISGSSSGANAMTPGNTQLYTNLVYGFSVRCRVMDRSDLQDKVVVNNTFEGEGTVANPYLIKTPNDLVRLSNLCDGSVVTADNEDFTVAHFALANDINMQGVGFSPIAPFKGSFDGRTFTISNLTVTPKDDASPTGMFGVVEGATIKNLNIKSASVFVTQTSQLYTGGLVGKATNATISNITFEGSVSSATKASYTGTLESREASAVVGGLVGLAVDTNISDITYCGLVTTTAGQYVGGIVSILEGGSVKRATFAKGSTLDTTMNNVGGIAGLIGLDAEVSDCTVDAPVHSKHAYVGGIVGRMQSGEVSNCLVTSNASVMGHKNNPANFEYYATGGIIGVLQTKANLGTKAIVKNCACYTDISSNCYVGGIIGNLSCDSTTVDAEVSCCVFKGNLSVYYKNSYNYGLSGGLIGCCNQSGAKGNSTKVTDCVALIDSFKFSTTATSSGYGGITGYTKTTDYVRCYTNLDLATMVSVEEGKTISEYTNLKYYGALHGRTSGATNKNNFTNVYYLIGQKIGQEAATSETNVEALSISQMTDGTLLDKLNAAGGSWVADATGYPVPTAAPADTAPSTSVAKTRVSIIGDSISTFQGWMPSGYVKFYPIASNPTVISASQTYWYKLIYKYMSNAMLDMNIAWSGTVVARSTDADYLATDHGAGHCFVERFIDDGMGNPDVILLHGGTNDVGNRGKSIAVHPNYPTYGGSGYSNTMCPTDEEMAAVFATADAATTRSDLEALNDTSFVEAYVKLLSLMHQQYPNAKVVMIIGDWIHPGTRQAIHKIATHYGTKYGYKCVDLQDISPFQSYTVIPKESGCHPNEAGFEVMANYIYQQVGDYID